MDIEEIFLDGHPRIDEPFVDELQRVTSPLSLENLGIILYKYGDPLRALAVPHEIERIMQQSMDIVMRERGIFDALAQINIGRVLDHTWIHTISCLQVHDVLSMNLGRLILDRLHHIIYHDEYTELLGKLNYEAATIIPNISGGINSFVRRFEMGAASVHVIHSLSDICPHAFIMKSENSRLMPVQELVYSNLHINKQKWRDLLWVYARIGMNYGVEGNGGITNTVVDKFGKQHQCVLQRLIHHLVDGDKIDEDAKETLISLRRNGIIDREDIKNVGADVIPGAKSYMTALERSKTEFKLFQLEWTGSEGTADT